MAITEAHLHCSREEQLRWLSAIWKTANRLKYEGVDVQAVTFWALLGSFGWNKLLVKPRGDYEPGIFDIRGARPRPTILSKLVQSFSRGEAFHHPVLGHKGWWQMDKRILYNKPKQGTGIAGGPRSAPVLIIGKTGTLGFAFGRACASRNIHYHLSDRRALDITNALQVESVMRELKPWAIINTAGYVRVDEAEQDPGTCYRVNTAGPAVLAAVCAKYGTKLVIFSSDLVFDGSLKGRYRESDPVNPLNVYGDSKAKAEREVSGLNPDALIIRTAAFFGPWDQYNFVSGVLNTLKQGHDLHAEEDVWVSPTYVPDLADHTLDLLMDDEKGIWHLSNDGALSWAELALEVAGRARLNQAQIKPMSAEHMNYRALRPKNSSLESGKGICMPSLSNALDRYFRFHG